MEQWEQKARAVLNISIPRFKWIAMDESGDWMMYSKKPTMDCNEWFTESLYCEYVQDWVDIYPAPSWKNSLIERSE